jgi:hypothetical protein
MFFQDLLGLCRKDSVSAYREMVAAAERGERVYPDPEIERLAKMPGYGDDRGSGSSELPTDHTKDGNAN